MEKESHVQALPEEMLADVLRRLAPRSLAASRCVCKAWRAAVDARRLLRAQLLPHALGGLFVDFNMQGRPEFFSASSSSPDVVAVSGDLGFTPEPKSDVADHCNGLLLRWRDVVNDPATRQWAPLLRWRSGLSRWTSATASTGEGRSTCTARTISCAGCH
ncbi:unnamed protein product [Urochloa humidicola]